MENNFTTDKWPSPLSIRLITNFYEYTKHDAEPIYHDMTYSDFEKMISIPKYTHTSDIIKLEKKINDLETDNTYLKHRLKISSNNNIKYTGEKTNKYADTTKI